MKENSNSFIAKNLPPQLLIILMAIFNSLGMSALEPSGTLPIVHINTENHQPIIDKENYIRSEMWISIPEGCETKDFGLGTEINPVSLQVKGRGNYTWLLDKKPYKLKFDKKTSVLGMPKHKHFALLASQGYYDWIGQAMGKDLARIIGLGWTPGYQPVELVLNGEFLGLYFVYESVKIDPNRLDIFEQEDELSEPETVPFGWLVEIDNYSEPNTIFIRDEAERIRLTPESPEILSDLQKAWLTYEFTSIVAVLLSDDPERWVNYIDPVSLVRYFIVCELMSDPDGFNGSVYMHRDAGENIVWELGPMWDNTFASYEEIEPTDWTMNCLPEWARWKLVPMIFKTQAFRDTFLTEWNRFYPSLDDIKTYMTNLSDRCKEADRIDSELWGRSSYIDDEKLESIFRGLEQKAAWIEAHKCLDINTDVGTYAEEDVNVVCTSTFSINGIQLGGNTDSGIRIQVRHLSNGSIESEKIVK